MTTRLVVGFDGSPASTGALRWAAARADQQGSALRVISSFALPPAMDYYGMGLAAATPEERAALRDACLQQSQRAVDAVRQAHPSIGVDFEAVDADAADALLTEAAASSAELIALGSSGAGAARSVLLGSVAAKVIHKSAQPVVLVPAEPRPVIGRIVVGTDGSEPSDRAVRWAAEEAARTGAELTVIHAWKYPYRLTESGVDRAVELVEVDAALVLERAVALARDLTTGEVTGTLAEDGAVNALLYAGDTADLVVVGSRGRGGFRAMLFGSVALNVSAHATCPVAVVH